MEEAWEQRTDVVSQITGCDKPAGLFRLRLEEVRMEGTLGRGITTDHCLSRCNCLHHPWL